jgi:hypothetical protein
MWPRGSFVKILPATTERAWPRIAQKRGWVEGQPQQLRKTCRRECA